MKILHIISVVFIMAAIVSCGGDKSKEVSESDLMAAEDSILQFKSFYKIPTPVELFTFMNQNGAVFDNSLLNKPVNASKYLTTKSKALNFGIYAADMAYCVVFNQFQETFSYFNTNKKLAEELELNQGFGEQIARRVQDNLYNIDSLSDITANSYWEACNFLEKQDKLELLTVILTGSWIESLYLSINTVKKFSADNPIVVRISEQGILLDNLLEFINMKTPDAYPDLIENLVNLRDTYDLLLTNDDNTVITIEQFNQIKKQVNTVRNQFIQ